ncbi:hypothetical protein V866_003189 [Kwoniella sp. B9012]
MPRSMNRSPGESTTTSETVTKTVTTGSQTEIITTAIITTIIQQRESNASPSSRRSSIDMSEERRPFRSEEISNWPRT